METDSNPTVKILHWSFWLLFGLLIIGIIISTPYTREKRKQKLNLAEWTNNFELKKHQNSSEQINRFLDIAEKWVTVVAEKSAIEVQIHQDELTERIRVRKDAEAARKAEKRAARKAVRDQKRNSKDESSSSSEDESSSDDEELRKRSRIRRR